jgi:hypothetical protein
MLAAGTVDQDIYNVIERKRSVVDAAIDGGPEEPRLPVATALLNRYLPMESK